MSVKHYTVAVPPADFEYALPEGTFFEGSLHVTGCPDGEGGFDLSCVAVNGVPVGLHPDEGYEDFVHAFGLEEAVRFALESA